MRIAVIEDEKPHRDLLVRYLEDWRSTQKESIILEAFNSSEAFWFRYEENREYDILFIDIQMPGMSGMELARKVRSGDGDIVLVFVTGIGDYLEEGYEVEALHYLRKPLSREKLEKCLEKALQRRKKGVFVTVHTGEEILKISQECVNYVEARGRNCCIGRVREPEELAVKESFSEMEKLLEEGEFVKCHRSFLCRISNIHHIGREEIFFDDGSSIPVSRRLWQQVNQRFISYFQRQ